MIQLKNLSIGVRIIGKTNVVLTVGYLGTFAQLNMRKVKSKWEFTAKKDFIDWGSVFNEYMDGTYYVSHKWNSEYGKAQSIERYIVPALEKYLYEKEVEKILLH